MDPMKEAMKRRRGQGFDITIMVNDKPVGDDKTSDLAPPPAKPEMEAVSPLEAEGEVPQELAAEEDPAALDEAMLSGMTDHDKAQAEAPHKPKSLGDRARMAMMGRLKK
jgi:hypothetical protein